MVLIQADEQFKTIDRVVSMSDGSGSTLDSLTGGTEPGTERRPVRGSMMLDMVHQMRDGRRIEECGQPHQRDSETERDADAHFMWNLVLYAPSIRGFDVTIGARNLVGRREAVPTSDEVDRDGGETPITTFPGEGREFFARVGFSY